ncbi:hypothetical protein D3C81_1712190 [compost metagenome]
MAQAEVLGYSVVFTIAGALPQCFDWRFPVVDFVPQVDVFDVPHLFVEEAVNDIELFQLTDLLLAGQQILPIVDALLTFAQRSVQCLRSPADHGKVPVGAQVAQHRSSQQQCAAQPA